jgi:hypothetical protein
MIYYGFAVLFMLGFGASVSAFYWWTMYTSERECHLRDMKDLANAWEREKGFARECMRLSQALSEAKNTAALTPVALVKEPVKAKTSAEARRLVEQGMLETDAGKTGAEANG